MTPKPNKNSQLWSQCNECNNFIPSKDTQLHLTNCPPQKDKYCHPLVVDGIFYSTLDIKKNEDIPGLSNHEINDLLFLSQTVIQICDFKIGESVIVKVYDETCRIKERSVIRTVWPTMEKSVTSVLITQQAMNVTWKNLNIKHVTVSKLNEAPALAKCVILKNLDKSLDPELSTEITKRIHRTYTNKLILTNNKLYIRYYGKLLFFVISEVQINKEDNKYNIPENNLNEDSDTVEPDIKQINKVTDCISNFANMCLSPSSNSLYKITEKTKIILKEEETYVDHLIGLEKEKMKILDLIQLVYQKQLNHIDIIHGVLLYGFQGTGKTSLMKSIALLVQNKFNAHVIEINNYNLYTKYSNDIEENLRLFFQEAITNSPSLILIDEIDLLCPSRTSRLSEQEKRINSILMYMLENVHEKHLQVVTLASSNKPDSIDPALRRFGHLDLEIEIPVPDQNARKLFISSLLEKVPNDIQESQLFKLASITPGFVGSDLQTLFSNAMMNSQKRSQNINLSFVDFEESLKFVKPSAMRESIIESPNVLWSDIGGQKDLKLKLKQALEWPLSHPESFERMGIKPPRGVLMYGPPGCSKTMIAKAIATEGRFSFLSIKGPELFNKYVGESERAIRDLFKKARQVSPTIVFFDEIDAIGGERTISGAGNSVQERVLAQLLTELDGVTALGNVVVVAATNRPDRIDKALLRPGRLDRIIYVPLPDFDTRIDIFSIKLRKMPVVNIDIIELVIKTEGYSGAEIEAVCNEAAMKALEENIDANEINMLHFMFALEMVTPRTPKSLLKIYEDYTLHSIN